MESLRTWLSWLVPLSWDVEDDIARWTCELVRRVGCTAVTQAFHAFTAQPLPGDLLGP